MSRRVVPPFEALIDHNRPEHHGQMERLARELKAWASAHGVTRLVREARELRPGVVQLRFSPAATQPQRRFHQDRLLLTAAR